MMRGTNRGQALRSATPPNAVEVFARKQVAGCKNRLTEKRVSNPLYGLAVECKRDCEGESVNGPDTDKVFAGSVPRLYETYLVPLIFEPYAADLVSRVATRSPSR